MCYIINHKIITQLNYYDYIEDYFDILQNNSLYCNTNNYTLYMNIYFDLLMDQRMCIYYV